MKITDLKDAEYNPRTIREESLAGLAYSMDAFGDLSGIVFNKRTGNLVCGHQRKKALIQKYGDDLTVVEESESEGVIQTPSGEKFRVRFVEWDIEKERAANIVANSETIQGQFTTDVQDLLVQVQSDSPELFEETLLFELMPLQEEEIIVPEEGDGRGEMHAPTLAYGDIVQFGDHFLMVAEPTREALSDLYQAVGEKATLSILNAPKWVKGKFHVEQSTDDIAVAVEEMCKALVFMTRTDISRIVIASETYTVSTKEKTRAGVKTLKTERYMSPLWQSQMSALGFMLRHNRFFVHQSSYNPHGSDDEVGGTSKIIQTFSDQPIEVDEERIENEIQTYIYAKTKERESEPLVAYWRDQRVWEDKPIEFYKRIILLYTQKRSLVFSLMEDGVGLSLFASQGLDRRWVGVCKTAEDAEALLLRYASTVKTFSPKGINRDIDFSTLLSNIKPSGGVENE